MKLIDLFEQQVVIKGDVWIPHETITLVGYKHKGKPIAQAKVLGTFNCSHTGITSLEQGPSYVGRDFDCYNTKITSLEQGPSWVGGYFNCSDTNITSLQGAPSYVGGDFACFQTKITSLQGGPSYVGGKLDCSGTKITSLHNIHKQIKDIDGELYLSKTIKSHMLGVMFIKGLQSIEFYNGNTRQKQAERIINKHLAGDRDIHLAQEELLEAGLSEFAKL